VQSVTFGPLAVEAYNCTSLAEEHCFGRISCASTRMNLMAEHLTGAKKKKNASYEHVSSFCLICWKVALNNIISLLRLLYRIR